MNNRLFVIEPYKRNGTWMFDDERVGLRGEPFVAGMPEIIETILHNEKIQQAEDGFVLVFSAYPFPGAKVELRRLREDVGGNWYAWTQTGMEGWLCPALFHYFATAPEQLFVQAKAK